MKNNSHKLLLILSLTFFILSCFGFFVLYKEINNNEKITGENELKLQKEIEKTESIKLLNSSIKKIESERDLIETHFAHGSNVVPFLNTMESLGNKAGVKTEVTLVDIPKESRSLVIEMNTLGSFEGIYKFLLLLENSQYQLEILSMDIQKEKNETMNVSNKKGVSSIKDGVVISAWKANLKIRLLSFVQ